MSKVQKVYRVIRPHVSREEARYAAPRLVDLGAKWTEKARAA
jgi:hypothetical protein